MLKIIARYLNYVALFVLLSPAPLVLAEANAGPTSPITEGQRVYACTHSLFPSVPNFVRDLAASANIPNHEVVGMSVKGGTGVVAHWREPDETNMVKQALIGGQVDVLTLATLLLPDEGIEKFAQLAVEHNPKIRVLLSESWIAYDELNVHYWTEPKIPRPTKVDHNIQTVESLTKLNAPYLEQVKGVVTSLNQKYGKPVVFVVPCCQAVALLRAKVIKGEAVGIKDQDDLFADATGHPKSVLNALAGYCHFAVIYRRSPVGLPLPKLMNGAAPRFVLDNTKNPDADKLNKLLQELAWQAVTSDPLSGVRQ